MPVFVSYNLLLILPKNSTGIHNLTEQSRTGSVIPSLLVFQESFSEIITVKIAKLKLLKEKMGGYKQCGLGRIENVECM